ncbi:glycosyltransferase family 4 protein [Halolamina salifodinae]|uniref:Glycosyltransferase involved in cell wall biosynthesis n=1 Tax=Halolamina salifodinae TaxID=1202767 RepID=A0A8T4GXN6_9EURY|nr:glycosyltransferase family 4 protein [Halolamina salifodinae]MBP1987797.1 glycosyltransferase involved in cell wall biosynthesis [Halolamina salifodinae]
MSETKRVAVAHHNLMEKGGGEAVAMNVLEALQDHYAVTLLTLTEPDLPELNSYYNTNVNKEAIEINRLSALFERIYDHSKRFHLFKNAVLSRLVQREQYRFDLVFNTYNEFSLGDCSLQYIHMPQFRRWLTENEKSGPLFGIYDKLCMSIENFDPARIQSSELLANSEWTAEVVAESYHTTPRVIYPPIDTAEFSGTVAEQRESGFVTIGRLMPHKNVLRTIRIIDQLHDRGHDVHVHVIGPTINSDYAKRIEAVADSREFVHLEGEVSRNRLVDLISTHKYGIHGMDHEHFGMAVAELAAGGTIPFVPNGGGQREIVHKREELLYESVEEAVEKIDRVLSDPELRRELRAQLGDIEERFGRERFKTTIRETVEQALYGSV